MNRPYVTGEDAHQRQPDPDHACVGDVLAEDQQVVAGQQATTQHERAE